MGLANPAVEAEMSVDVKVKTMTLLSVAGSESDIGSLQERVSIAKDNTSVSAL